MNNKQFFDEVASKWDEMCHHDEKKMNKIIGLSEVKEGSKILDVGTGTGILISYLLKTNPSKIKAVDISENMIKVAKQKYSDSKVEFVVKNVLEFEEKRFDYIFLYSVYPHFKYKDKVISHLSDLLNKSGKLIIAHSDSKERINEIHRKREVVKDDVLPSGKDTADLMSKYLKVNMIIDSVDMYYVSGIKTKL
ncbi:class I SAM-dependent methyltransferase [Haloimpatiens sp. FM7330]|uniref:class I SAM-dependent methyltransferase n=1 Tax=Haloimpatiens sp. FM7330 TaxID=3298610 RepID=UPI00363153EC